MPITPTPKIWMNGELVDWDKAQIHVLTHTLHYGMGVFEGIRAYETAEGPAVFRLTDHIVRLANSAKILGMDLPYTVDELIEATKATVASTGLPACYVRPIAYFGYGEMGLNTLPCSVDVAIACWPWGAYLGDDAVTKGVRMKISSWTRHDHNTMPPASKTTGNYVNSSLAKVEALKAGYDEAIMLAPNGLVAECSGENLFISRNDILITPPLSAGALEGITQNSVMTIGRDLGFDVRIDNIARSDLYIADEAFVCGTAAEVSSVNSVDDRVLPCPGPEDEGHRRGVRAGRAWPGGPLQGLVRARGLSPADCSAHRVSQHREEPVAIGGHHDERVRLATGESQQVHHHHPACDGARGLDLAMEPTGLGRDRWVDRVRHRDRVGEVEAGELGLVQRERVHDRLDVDAELGQGRADRADRGRVGRIQHGEVPRDVPPDELDRQPGPQHHLDGVRVDPHVELGDRVGVADVIGDGAHHHTTGDPLGQ